MGRKFDNRKVHRLPFENWLRKNTTLGELTIQLTGRTIKNFKMGLHGKKSCSIAQVNEFITKNFREKRKSYVKYAFKHYFNYIRQPEAYKQLIKVKAQSRKKKGVYLDRKLLIQIINHIKPLVYRDVAMIQFATGGRGREIVTLHENDIDLYFEDDTIRIQIRGKGDKVRYGFLTRDFEPMLKKYMGRGYLFLPKSMNTIPDSDFPQFNRRVSSYMTYFYNALSNSALDFGIENFGTHDLRRNAADIFRKKFKDIFLVKQMLGHSNVSTTIKYFADNPEDIKEAMTKFQKNKYEEKRSAE